MTKYDLVAHLANLTFVFDAHERLGTSKNRLLLEEFHATEVDLYKLLEKEKSDAARQSNDKPRRLDEG